jgi:uncharacterized protein YdeI (YjbR/CyaY-like superfamily)
LKQHHQSASELWVGFHKKGSKPSLTWSEAVDEALCFGWIDGIRKKVDEERYANRFTPRRTATWSAVNIRRARTLIAAGRMQPAGLKAFEARDRKKSGYSIAQRATIAFSPAAEKTFRANRAAWTFFEGLPPAYRRNHIWFVESAKKTDTRERRLENLIRACANGIRLDPMRPLKDQVPHAD